MRHGAREQWAILPQIPVRSLATALPATNGNDLPWRHRARDELRRAQFEGRSAGSSILQVEGN
jgi:hypothetical protein